MPARNTPLVTGEFYHIFNRGINKQPIFLSSRDYKRSVEMLRYYSFANVKLRYSKFLLLSNEERNRLLSKYKKENKKIVNIISFCLMPNHFHLLLQQSEDGGISNFLSIFQNSYTRFFNTKYTKIGPILQGQFKAVHIEDEYQLLHLSRYIHLNPFTSFIVQKIEDLEKYLWSSFTEYLKEETIVDNSRIILSNFKTMEDYKKFVFDQGDYQRELDKIKHLTIE